MTTTISAKIIADSVNARGDRLVTVEATFHRFILAELNTHRAFSRNSASSRAIPVDKQLKRVLEDPAIPVEFGANQPGMQAGEPLDGQEAIFAKLDWLASRDDAMINARRLLGRGVHKQVTNRILEPFMWHTAIISSTEWENFFAQRCSPLAQPEIRVLAERIREAIAASTAVSRINVDDPHLPYIGFTDERCLPIGDQIRISVARCARVSYLTQGGVRDIEEDLRLYERLVSADPPHWSPLEHVAVPAPIKETTRATTGTELVRFTGNFTGWAQVRHLVPSGLDIDLLGEVGLASMGIGPQFELSPS